MMRSVSGMLEKGQREYDGLIQHITLWEGNLESKESN